ncbi:MAG: type 1 glutamine amidotransferase [Oligoflexus sp.]
MSLLLRPLHLAVIDPAVRVPELDNFNRLALGAPEVCLSYHLPALFGMSSLEQVAQQPDALLIFGSGASVYDDLPWQKPLNDWLIERIGEGFPILGICYGHQLLAHLLGGKVAFARPDQEKFKGLRPIQFSQRGFWGDAGTKGRYIVSHREVVTDLPRECRTVASSAEVSCEAFAHETLPIWGIQGHPEAGPVFLDDQGIVLDLEEKPFASGQDFMRRFVQHILQQRIQ